MNKLQEKNSKKIYREGSIYELWWTLIAASSKSFAI